MRCHILLHSLEKSKSRLLRRDFNLSKKLSESWAFSIGCTKENPRLCRGGTVYICPLFLLALIPIGYHSFHSVVPLHYLRCLLHPPDFSPKGMVQGSNRTVFLISGPTFVYGYSVDDTFQYIHRSTAIVLRRLCRCRDAGISGSGLPLPSGDPQFLTAVPAPCLLLLPGTRPPAFLYKAGYRIPE